MSEKPLSEKRINLHASIGNNPAYCYFEKDVAKAVEGFRKDMKSYHYAKEEKTILLAYYKYLLECFEKWFGK